MSPDDVVMPLVRQQALARRRATWRWGGAIAAILIVQTLLLASLVMTAAVRQQDRSSRTLFAQECRVLGALPPEERPGHIRALIAQDIHRERFLALFDGGGRLIEGNVAAIPDKGHGPRIATVRPTQLPGKTSDVARLQTCAMPGGGQLLTGIDLDNPEDALRLIGRSTLIAISAGFLLALGFGLAAGRRAARQVDAVRLLSERIMAGDLAERLEIARRPDSFGLLCAHINAMLDRVQALVGDVRAVSDEIAHQLRTPLTRLRAQIERTLGTARDPVQFAAAGEAALFEIDKLLGIVAALLRIREIEDHARRSRFALVDLRRIAEDACDLHRPGVEEAGMRLECLIAPVSAVEGDASLLFEAVSNLIDNAIKFGPSGSRITLSLAMDPDGPLLTVTDEGAGITLAQREFVTQRFWRGRRDTEGTGLGLTLVQAIIQLHGGRMAFATSPSRVILHLPILSSRGATAFSA